MPCQKHASLRSMIDSDAERVKRRGGRQAVDASQTLRALAHEDTGGRTVQSGLLTGITWPGPYPMQPGLAAASGRWRP